MKPFPYWLFFLLAVAAAYGLSLFIPVDEVLPASLVIAEPAKATLEAIQESSKLLVTLNTTMLAAAASLIVKGKDWSASWAKIDGYLLLFTFVCGASSYYGVYVSQIDLLSMIAGGRITPLSSRLQFAIAIQYYGLLLGLVSMGVVFARMLEGRLPSEPAKPSKPPSRSRRR